MKREGIFCDKKVDEHARKKELCPKIAVGKCVACDEDVCAEHGCAEGLSLTLYRAVTGAGTLSHDRLANGAVTICTSCLNRLMMTPTLFTEHIVPSLLTTVAEIVKAALVGEALA